MMAIIQDTYSVVNTLVDGGFTQKQSEAMINVIQSINLEQIAAKQDVKGLRGEVKQDIAEFKVEVKQDIEQVRQDITDLNSKVTELKNEVGKEIAETKYDILKWMLIFFGGLYALIIFKLGI